MESFQTKVLFLICMVSTIITALPTSPSTLENKEDRQQKSLSFMNFFQNLDSNLLKSGHFLDLQETNLNKKDNSPFNSPIYYIRLPPQPYMYIPGVGYVSQPPPPPAPISQFVNLPLDFLANGKPTAIYQWSGAVDPLHDIASQSQPLPLPVTTTPKPQSSPNSPLYRLPGKFAFNGKPDDIFVLRDSYNSIYGDILQNIYP